MRQLNGSPFVQAKAPSHHPNYRKASSISRTKYENLYVSCLVSRLEEQNPIKVQHTVILILQNAFENIDMFIE